MLRLVHLEVVLAVLLVQLAGHGVRLWRSLHVVVKEAGAFVFECLRRQFLELILNNFRYFDLKHARQILKFGGQNFIDFRLEGSLGTELVLAT